MSQKVEDEEDSDAETSDDEVCDTDVPEEAKQISP